MSASLELGNFELRGIQDVPTYESFTVRCVAENVSSKFRIAYPESEDDEFELRSISASILLEEAVDYFLY